ncbi:MAG: Mu-like prophage major head subunit gpT family protein [Bacteroidales bacterium]
METKEIKAVISHVRALITPNTFNKEEGTFEVVFASENPIPTSHWDLGSYNEILSCDIKNVRMERASKGLPVFDGHYPRNAMSQLGTAENIKFSNGQATATIRLGARADDALKSDIEKGIINGISSGYNVYAYIQEGEIKKGSRENPTYKATDWEPTEISFAPVQADVNAGIRNQETGNSHILIINSNQKMENTTETVEQTRGQNTPETPATPLIKVDVAQIRQEATDANKARLDAILKSTRAAKMEDSKAIEFFASDKPIEEIRQLVIDTFVKAEPAKPNGHVDVTTGKEGIEKKREAAEQSVLNRIDSKAFPLEKVEGAREFRGLAVHEIAKEFMLERGSNIRMLSKEAIADLMFTGQRDMATGDFPLLLENVMNKALRGEYQYAQEFWSLIAKETSVSDFKAKSLYQVDSSNGMSELPEGDEIKFGKLTEARQTISVKSFGEGLQFTRKAFINDDLSALATIPSKFVLDWNTTQGDLIWAMLTNATDGIVMADGLKLFHATHKNLFSGAGTALADAGLTAALKAFKAQTGLDGVRKIRVTPEYLIVSPDLEVTARKLLYAALSPVQSSDVNVWAGAYTLIVEPRLTGNIWYLAADPMAIDGLYYAYLNGNAGLRSNRVDNFKTDSIEFAVRGEFGCAAIDYRGWQKNVGA